MRILLIDHNSQHLGQLQAICGKYRLDIVKGQKSEAGEENILTGVAIEDYDVILLCGSYVLPANEDDELVDVHELYRLEIGIIQNSGKPILGIGLGFELVCAAFGVVLGEVAEPILGATVVTPTDEGSRAFQGTDPIKVSETNRWQVFPEDLPKSLVVLASSETGVEALKHKTQPVYAMQLFPEEFTYASDGKLVVENIISTFRKAVAPAKALQNQ